MKIEDLVILFEVLTEKFVKDDVSKFIISCEFPQFLRNLPCEIITVRLGYHKFCASWIPKMLRGTTKCSELLHHL
jgi:hypothetical protein